MEKGLGRYVQITEPRSGLCEAILARIALLERRYTRVRAGLFSALALVCAAALIPATQYAAEQFYASGFYDYLTLIVSDHTLVLTYWRQFGLSLLESLPSLALLLFVPLIIVLAYSLRRAVQTGRVAFGRVHASA